MDIDYDTIPSNTPNVGLGGGIGSVLGFAGTFGGGILIKIDPIVVVTKFIDNLKNKTRYFNDIKPRTTYNNSQKPPTLHRSTENDV